MESKVMMKRHLIPPAAFLFGSILIASFYLGILTWAQGWEYASSQFLRDRWYVIPIIFSFGVQTALYSILRFRLFIPTATLHGTDTLSSSKGVMGASGGTSAAAMVACCIHHVTDVLPILGLSAAASFLTRYQRPFMLVGLAMNLIGMGMMLFVLRLERQRLHPLSLETI